VRFSRHYLSERNRAPRGTPMLPNDRAQERMVRNEPLSRRASPCRSGIFGTSCAAIPRIMRVRVALQRGLIVGTANRLPMTTLTDLFTRAGCSSVETYIQSGNVIYACPDVFAPSIPPESRTN
jgi:hypothetical protein